MLYSGVSLIFQPSCFLSDLYSNVFLLLFLELILLSCLEMLIYQPITQKASHLSYCSNTHPDLERTVGSGKGEEKKALFLLL